MLMYSAVQVMMCRLEVKVQVQVSSAGKAGLGSQGDCQKREHPFHRICNRNFRNAPTPNLNLPVCNELGAIRAVMA
jgi:hypothetical protein